MSPNVKSFDSSIDLRGLKGFLRDTNKSKIKIKEQIKVSAVYVMG